MKNLIKAGALSLVLLFTLGTLSSCKKDPSVLKVFVRSSSNQLLQDAKVIIIGDINSNPPTRSYVDTIMTNSTGFAFFDMTPYFTDKPTRGEIGYFDILVKKDGKTGVGRIRCRANITNVETVYMPQ